MKVYLDPDDIENMERKAGNTRDRLLIRILFRLGCRVSEALAIKETDIDFERGTVTIKHLKRIERLSCNNCNAALAKRHQFCPECGQEVSEATKRQQERRRQRALPLDSQTLDMLKEHIERGGPVVKERETLVFGISRHRAWQVVKECAEKADLPKLTNPETGKIRNVSPHRLRDAFAVSAVKFDGSAEGLRLLQEHLGHQSFNTTARYRKVSGDEHREWYQRLWGNLRL